MRKQQWEKIVSLANATYQNRRFMNVSPTDDFSAQISQQKGVSMGDLYHNLTIGKGHLLLDGQPVATPQEKEITQDFLERFYSLLTYDHATEARQDIQDEQKRRSVIQLAIRHEPQNLRVQQLGRLRSSHRQWKTIGEKQLQLEKTLRQNNWTASILRELSFSQKKEILSGLLEKEIGLYLIHEFVGSKRSYRAITNVLSLPQYKNNRFLWFSTSGGNEVEEYYNQFVCGAKCTVVSGTRHVPCILFIRFWRSKRKTQPIPINIQNIVVFPIDNEKPILKKLQQPLSPFYFHKFLKKIVQRQEITSQELGDNMKITFPK